MFEDLPYNEIMFPHRVDIDRRGAGTPDATRGNVNAYAPVALAVPCNIFWLVTWPNEATAPQSRDTIVRLIVSFPADPKLKHGDVLAELDEAGLRTGRGFAVDRVRFTGLATLRLWKADCRLRQ